jgi:hypothetical protein
MTDTTVTSVEGVKGGETKEEVRQNGDANDDQFESLCGKNGEWETRKISIMGVVKRFISQLSYGQELTRSHSLKDTSVCGICLSSYSE